MMNDPTGPLNDTIIVALAKLVDDAQASRRDPSHDDLKFQINRAGLTNADPAAYGQAVGKAKRVRAVLSWALEHDKAAGARFVQLLLAAVRAHGGFRETSTNFVGEDAIKNAASAFATEGYEFSSDGEQRAILLDNLVGPTLTAALKAYIRRAKKGADDAALVAGTGKDLLEAVAAHIVQERVGSYSASWNFPMLLGQAYIALNLVTPQHPNQPGEATICKMQRAFYELACAINALRNREGTGHGRPWLPTVTEVDARAAVEAMGNIAEYLLLKHMAAM